MHFVLPNNSSEHLQHVRTEGKKNYGRLFGSQEPGKAGHWLDFHGKIDSGALADSEAEQAGIDSCGVGRGSLIVPWLVGEKQGKM